MSRSRYTPFILFFVLLLGLFWSRLFATVPAVAQTPTSTPSPTPAPIPTANATTGLTLFSQRCANCHGPAGLGNGELAAQLPAPPTSFVDVELLQGGVPASWFNLITEGNLQVGMPPFGPSSSNPISEANRWDLIAAVYQLGTDPAAIDRGEQLFTTLEPLPEALAFFSDPSFWRNNSNQAAFDRLQAALPEQPEDALQDLVHYGRATFPFTSNSAIVASLNGTISGSVTNGTTGALQGEAAAILRAFNSTDFSIFLTMTTTVSASGSYSFTLTNVPADSVYLTSVLYNGLSFGSDIGQLSASQPTLNLPVTVFDQTTDPTVISIEQLHIILEIDGPVLQVSELYSFSNNSNAVFVGQTGDWSRGTLTVQLPAQAQVPSFQRGFGSLESFRPTDELIATDIGWQDTAPLRPGRGSMNLLVQYGVPYKDGITLQHLLAYETGSTSVVIPDVGIELVGDWQASAKEEVDGEVFIPYVGEGVSAGTNLILTLQGEPRITTSPQSNATVELFIGLGTLILVVGISIYSTQRARQNAQLSAQTEREELLQTIVDLDQAYAMGQIPTEQYLSERQQLKETLIEIWEDER